MMGWTFFENLPWQDRLLIGGAVGALIGGTWAIVRALDRIVRLLEEIKAKL